MIANIGPETIEEVYALVPSLKVSVFCWIAIIYVIMSLPGAKSCMIQNYLHRPLRSSMKALLRRLLTLSLT
jgi:hypothetical protein